MENKIDIGFAYLCIEIDEQGPRPEAFISLENKKDGTYQDICMVSQAVEPHSDKEIPNAVRCLVWSDPQNEDYTHEFVIEKYEDENAEAPDEPWYEEKWYKEDIENAMEQAGIETSSANYTKALAAVQCIFDDKSCRNEMLRELIENAFK